ncbi:MAG: TetR/AcrR family transcriptional regulator [Lachnospiraceae bacterium]|nr:TetR/AcrR family transcriptional regulator [Lachnospiraceae bacterium]
MKDERETKDKLLISAKQEFLEKGYQKASLRNICKNAGVTTGALYFFFQDKEDLFASIVQPSLDRIIAMLSQHTKQELMELQEHPDAQEDNMQDDIVASKAILDVLYGDYDNILLILTKSQGSRYEHCVDEFVDMLQQSYRVLSAEQARRMGVKSPDDYTLHWVSHIQIDAFVQLILHEPDKVKALEHLDSILRYLLAGWMALFEK